MNGIIRLRTLILLVFVAGLIISCTSNEGKLQGDIVNNPITADGEGDLDKLPTMEFRELVHDFGTVIEGEKVMYSFKCKNTGGSDLVISSVSASCGCTATKYTKEAIAPGDEGIVTVTFDTRKRRGFQSKAITVSANTQPNKVVLRIKAKVISPKDL